MMYDQAFSKDSGNNSPPSEDTRSYRPSKDIIAALDDAKKGWRNWIRLTPVRKKRKRITAFEAKRLE